MSESLFSKNWNEASEEDVSYSRLSLIALLAFFCALASLLIVISIWFFFLGLLGIILALIAISLIRRSNRSLTGIGLAQLALAISIISLVAVAVFWPCYHYGVRQEARQFFRIWFQALSEDNIPLAKNLTAQYWGRGNVDDREQWWKDQYGNKFAHKAIHDYVGNQLVRTLLALGKDAKVTYYKTLSVSTGEERDTVSMVFAVTFQAEKEKTETFFVNMIGERSYPNGDVKSAGWKLAKEPELIVPDEFNR